MVQTGSLPYVLLLAVVAIGVSVYLWAILDAAVAEIVVTESWTGGSEETERGRDHILTMWDFALAMVITSVSISVLIASRRRA